MEMHEQVSCSCHVASALDNPKQLHHSKHHARHVHHMRHSSARLVFVFWVSLVLATVSNCAQAARLFSSERKGTAPDSLRQWQTLLEHTDYNAFEDAYAATYVNSPSGNTTRTMAQFSQLVELLDQALEQQPGAAAVSVNHELHNYAVREIVLDAVQLSSKPYNETATLTVLEYISSRLTQLSSKYGYPAARRVIMGALLKARVEHGPFSKAIQQQVDKIMLQLFQLHKKSAATKGAVQFFHISKSGGTNLCQAAQSNGCTTEGFDERSNCLIKDFGDIPRWVAHTAHKYVEYRLLDGNPEEQEKRPWYVNFHSQRRSQEGCAERLALLRSNEWNFYANEYTTPPGEKGLCKEFVNLLLFRQPLDRLRSQISWIQKLYKGNYPTADIVPAFQDRTSGFWERLLPAAVNNYYIRSLLGQRFFEFPIVNIDDTHVQRAKSQVLLHDLLLTLEAKDFNEITLRVGLGWDSSLQDSNIRSSSDMKDEISMPVDYSVLEARNLLDVKVYDFAREMHTLDVLLFNFIALLDKKLALQNLSTDKCGYVSLDAL